MDKADVSSSADDPLTSVAGLKNEADDDTLSSAQASSRPAQSMAQLAESLTKETESVPAREPSVDRAKTLRSETTGSDESELKMPGTFHLSDAEKERIRGSGSRKNWGQALKKFGLFS